MVNKSKSRVLIVDDTPDHAWILIEALKHDYALTVAKDGTQALRFAESENAPDLILLDVVMPGMDGYEVCRKLKSNSRTQGIPVIFVTSQYDSGDKALGLDLGAMDYITKPFQPALVKTKIHNLIELKQHRDRLDDLVRQRTHALALTQEATINAMATLAEWRSPETGGHIKRAQNFVRALADYMSTLPEYSHILNGDMVERLYLSSPLHDVGKVCVSDSILMKPGKLTDFEFDQIKKHTEYGHDVLAAAEKDLGEHSFLKIAKEIAYSHHERWDGSGYPQGLKGEAIPLSARLMSVADVYDAMCSKRVYKGPMPHDVVVEEIQKSAGSHFDPAVVQAFLKVQDRFQEIAKHYLDDSESNVLTLAEENALVAGLASVVLGSENPAELHMQIAMKAETGT